MACFNHHTRPPGLCVTYLAACHGVLCTIIPHSIYKVRIGWGQGDEEALQAQAVTGVPKRLRRHQAVGWVRTKMADMAGCVTELPWAIPYATGCMARLSHAGLVSGIHVLLSQVCDAEPCMVMPLRTRTFETT